MAYFTEEWLATQNQRIAELGGLTNSDGAGYLVVFELRDAPAGEPHAITLSVSPTGASLQLGDHIAADAIIAIGFDDAVALLRGELNGLRAWRENRLKVRGDTNQLVNLTGWLYPATTSSEDVAL